MCFGFGLTVQFGLVPRSASSRNVTTEPVVLVKCFGSMVGRPEGEVVVIGISENPIYEIKTLLRPGKIAKYPNDGRYAARFEIGIVLKFRQ